MKSCNNLQMYNILFKICKYMIPTSEINLGIQQFLKKDNIQISRILGAFNIL